jgi:hypothetical protein
MEQLVELADQIRAEIVAGRESALVTVAKTVGLPEAG